MKYTSHHFREVYPAWGWKKCSFTVRHLYRPLSFPCAAWAANHGITANAVSYASSLVAMIGCALFFVHHFAARIVGAILFNVWLLMDCIDGNLARGVKKQPFGEFADAMGGYLQVGFMGVALGYAAYVEGGVLIRAGMPWLIVFGAIASSADSLMRLIYQKYKSVERELVDEGRITLQKDIWKDPAEAQNFLVRIEFEFGICGIIPLALLVATVFHALDLMVIYCFCYYGLAFIGSVLMYVRKAVKWSKKLDN